MDVSEREQHKLTEAITHNYANNMKLPKLMHWFTSQLCGS